MAEPREFTDKVNAEVGRSSNQSLPNLVPLEPFIKHRPIDLVLQIQGLPKARPALRGDSQPYNLSSHLFTPLGPRSRANKVFKPEFPVSTFARLKILCPTALWGQSDPHGPFCGAIPARFDRSAALLGLFSASNKPHC